LTDGPTSYRAIVRSTGIIGGASIAVLLVGLVRSKLVALMIGPAGTGMFGLLNSLVATTSTFAALGIGTSAVALIAKPSDSLVNVIRGLRTLALILALAAGVLVWLLRTIISAAIVGDQRLAEPIGWAGLAVGLSVMVMAQNSIFQGRRRFGDLATLQIGGAVLGTVAGIAFIYWLGLAGVMPAVVAAPAGTWLVGLVLARSLTRGKPASRNLSALRDQWQPLLRIGIPVMLASLVSGLTQLALRSIVLRELGLDDVGLYQAAITITTMNVGLVLTAMSADFFPRLAQADHSPERMTTLVDHQLNVAALLSMPILILLSSGAGVWLHLLYSGAFVPAANLLRWQVVAEVIRIPVWALGYVLLARRDTVGYFVHEISLTVTALPLTWLLVHSFGITGAGMGYAGGYFVCLLVTYGLVRQRHGVSVAGESRRTTAALFAITLIALVAGTMLPRVTMIAGFALGIAAGVWVITQLHRREALPMAASDFLRRARARFIGGR
jgi:O-antigen/teichoic acid export membrane protein